MTAGEMIPFTPGMMVYERLNPLLIGIITTATTETPPRFVIRSMMGPEVVRSRHEIAQLPPAKTNCEHTIHKASAHYPPAVHFDKIADSLWVSRCKRFEVRLSDGGMWFATDTHGKTLAHRSSPYFQRREAAFLWCDDRDQYEFVVDTPGGLEWLRKKGTDRIYAPSSSSSPSGAAQNHAAHKA